MAVIAIDLGGTKLAGAVCTSQGRILFRQVRALEGRRGNAVSKLVAATLQQLLSVAAAANLPISAIGVCVPGIADQDSGRVWAPNIPGWTNFPLRRALQTTLQNLRAKKKILNQPKVVIESDRACYILGETWKGAARGCADAVFLAVGTGIGAGILVNGQVVRGANDIAGAIGWLALSCPFRSQYEGCGCFEYHASGGGMPKAARQWSKNWPRNLTAEDIFRAAETNDPAARKILKEAVSYWGMAVANLVSLLNPQVIILGGGVFGPGAKLLGEIKKEARLWAQPIAFKKVKIKVSRLGGNAGLLGAAYSALLASK